MSRLPIINFWKKLYLLICSSRVDCKALVPGIAGDRKLLKYFPALILILQGQNYKQLLTGEDELLKHTNAAFIKIRVLHQSYSEKLRSRFELSHDWLFLTATRLVKNLCLQIRWELPESTNTVVMFLSFSLEWYLSYSGCHKN